MFISAHMPGVHLQLAGLSRHLAVGAGAGAGGVSSRGVALPCAVRLTGMALIEANMPTGYRSSQFSIGHGYSVHTHVRLRLHFHHRLLARKALKLRVA